MLTGIRNCARGLLYVEHGRSDQGGEYTAYPCDYVL